MPDTPFSNVYNTNWPAVTFVVVGSIAFNSATIPVFVLGRRVNTLTITLTYSSHNEVGP